MGGDGVYCIYWICSCGDKTQIATDSQGRSCWLYGEKTLRRIVKKMARDQLTFAVLNLDEHLTGQSERFARETSMDADDDEHMDG